MKLRALITAAFLTIATSALAQWFPARVNVVVLPGQVAAEVFNPYYEPLICAGQVFGQTSRGPVFTTYFVEQFMPIGAHRYSYVQTHPFAPFVGGWANINCRFARTW